MDDSLESTLSGKGCTWLVTGAAGFIGSHLVHRLLELDQTVVGLDNFLTGFEENIQGALAGLTPRRQARFEFIKGDITRREDCARAARGAEFVLHQAALGSVSRSIEAPGPTTEVNVTGFINVLEAARAAGARRFVFASSSSIYGDAGGDLRVESEIGNPLSPYAVSKRVNEMHAELYGRLHGFATIGLRYFNVFGPRQDPRGAYAAVIPKWIKSLMDGEEVQINGDGLTSRDFCYVDNVVRANLLAATAADARAFGQIYNVACNDETNLSTLFEMIRERVAGFNPSARQARPKHVEFRRGDIRRSRADISKIRSKLGYSPLKSLADGLDVTVPWFVARATDGLSGSATPKP